MKIKLTEEDYHAFEEGINIAYGEGFKDIADVMYKILEEHFEKPPETVSSEIPVERPEPGQLLSEELKAFMEEWKNED